jgi:hypothetical protein
MHVNFKNKNYFLKNYFNIFLIKKYFYKKKYSWLTCKAKGHVDHHSWTHAVAS